MSKVLISLIIAGAAIGVIEGVPLLKKKRMYKEFIAAISILVIAISMWILNSMGVPTSLKFLNDLLNPIGRAIFRT